MSLKERILGPHSKYEKDIPYTYVARVQAIEGMDDIINEYFADTICGLVEYLVDQGIAATETRVFGLYRKEEIALDLRHCTDTDGKWLIPPDLCHSLEEHYKQSMEQQYRGHVEHGSCSFEDRDKQGSGPY
ncbi:MAG TPA: hypothetical protein PK916_07170 [Bacteroidota bacterium]|nr:hypothetical protein [Bacteroidota bacterium]